MKEAIRELEDELEYLEKGGRPNMVFYEDYNEYLEERSTYYKGIRAALNLLKRRLESSENKES